VTSASPGYLSDCGPGLGLGGDHQANSTGISGRQAPWDSSAEPHSYPGEWMREQERPQRLGPTDLGSIMSLVSYVILTVCLCLTQQWELF
jgi:hypothetical protein